MEFYNEKTNESIKLQIGCNYHTTWQRNKSMRFVLKEIKGNQARLVTRTTRSNFWTNITSLIFITTRHNIVIYYFY